VAKCRNSTPDAPTDRPSSVTNSRIVVSPKP